MRRLLYIIINITWGLPQTLAGAFVFLACARQPHFVHHGAVVTTWKARRGLSLGLFLFLPESADDRLLVHEYGHSVQSLILGPLYLVVVGIPSMLWSMVPAFATRRNKHGISYYSFLPERTASTLGTFALHRPALK